jgi:predicted nucleic acid-binding protein
MATYVLDTGVLLGYVRGAAFAGYIDKKYSPSIAPNVPLSSIVSVAELHSLALHRNWGGQKQSALTSVLRAIPAIPVRHDSIVRKFADIDAFNHRKHPSIPNPPSGYTLGDNDTWIAATASVLNATLLTTDHDFDHLHSVFLTVAYIDQKLTPTDA